MTSHIVPGWLACCLLPGFSRPYLITHLVCVRACIVSASLADLCSSQQLQQFLLQQKYQLPPLVCESFRAQQRFDQQCQAFFLPLPAANEDFQVTSFAGAFVGAALLPEIIQHVYGGDRRYIFQRQDVYPASDSSNKQPYRCLLVLLSMLCIVLNPFPIVGCCSWSTFSQRWCIICWGSCSAKA